MSGKSKLNKGDVIGYITILEDTGKREKNGAVVFKCRCKCGIEFERRTESIFNSVRKGCFISCGCEQRKKASLQGKKSNVGTNPYQKECAIKSLKQIDGTTLVSIQRKKVNKNSSTGVTGVSYAKRNEKHKYRVRLQLKRKEIFLGYADTLEEAKEIRKRGEEKYYQPVIEKYKELENEV